MSARIKATVRNWNADGSSSACASMLYGTLSITMIFLNKHVLKSYHFPVPVLLFCQYLFTFIALRIFHYFHIVDFALPSPSVLRAFFIPAFLYTTTVVCSLIALKVASVPVYTVIKRTTPAVSLVLAVLILGEKPNKRIVGSLALTFIGTLITGFGDMLFDITAYGLGLVACCSQACYLTYVQKYGVENGVDTWTSLYANAFLCLPLSIMVAIASEDIFTFEYSKQTIDAWIALFIVLIFGMGLNFALFWCTLVNSAVTTCVVGVAKGVITICFGFLLDTQPVTAALFIGVSCSFIGSTLYAIEKLRMKQYSVQYSHVRQDSPPSIEMQQNTSVSSQSENSEDI